MDNKIKHYSATQSIPDGEFLPLLRGENLYFGNLNRPAQSAFNLANTVAELQSWGGYISILPPLNNTDVFQLYEIARIEEGELLAKATATDPVHSRYGIVVAEAEFDLVSGLTKNIIVCTYCPNFIYPVTPSWSAVTNGNHLYFTTTDPTFLHDTPAGTNTEIAHAPLACKTSANSIFFTGTVRLFGV
jgi:hypothetical protein